LVSAFFTDDSIFCSADSNDFEVSVLTSVSKESIPVVLVFGKIAWISEEKTMPPTTKIEAIIPIFRNMFD
jgi:hypothetical protein